MYHEDFRFHAITAAKIDAKANAQRAGRPIPSTAAIDQEQGASGTGIDVVSVVLARGFRDSGWISRERRRLVARIDRRRSCPGRRLRRWRRGVLSGIARRSRGYGGPRA